MSWKNGMEPGSAQFAHVLLLCGRPGVAVDPGGDLDRHERSQGRERRVAGRKHVVQRQHRALVIASWRVTRFLRGGNGHRSVCMAEQSVTVTKDSKTSPVDVATRFYGRYLIPSHTSSTEHQSLIKY